MNEPETEVQPSPQPKLDLIYRDFYQKPWAGLVIAFAALQGFCFPYGVFFMMILSCSASKTFLASILWFFVIQPAACFFMILYGLASEGTGFNFLARPNWRVLLFMFFLVCSLVLYAVSVTIGLFYSIITSLPIAAGILLLYSCVVWW